MSDSKWYGRSVKLTELNPSKELIRQIKKAFIESARNTEKMLGKKARSIKFIRQVDSEFDPETRTLVYFLVVAWKARME